MYKRYLLLAGYDSHLKCDVTNLIDSFLSFEAAKEEVKNIERTDEEIVYEIRGKQYDWYHIERMFSTGYTEK